MVLFNAPVLTIRKPRSETKVTKAAQQFLESGTGTSAVALADFAEDSRIDLVVTNDGAKTVLVLLNTTASTMAAASRWAPARHADTQIWESVWSDQIMALAMIDLFSADMRIS